MSTVIESEVNNMIIPKVAIKEIATEAITDVASVSFDAARKALTTASAVSKAAISVKGTIGRSSITRMGRDSIMEFPTVAEASIDTDDQIAIAKMLERNYATLLVSIFSLRPSISLNEFDNIAEYLKTIHTNSALPSNLKKAQHFAKESLEDTSDLKGDDTPLIRKYFQDHPILFMAISSSSFGGAAESMGVYKKIFGKDCVEIKDKRDQLNKEIDHLSSIFGWSKAEAKESVCRANEILEKMLHPGTKGSSSEFFDADTYFPAPGTEANANIIKKFQNPDPKVIAALIATTVGGLGGLAYLNYKDKKRSKVRQRLNDRDRMIHDLSMELSRMQNELNTKQKKFGKKSSPNDVKKTIDEVKKFIGPEIYDKNGDNLDEKVLDIIGNLDPNSLKELGEWTKSINDAMGNRSFVSFESVITPDEYGEFCLADAEHSDICIDGHISDFDSTKGKELALECWGVQAGALDMTNLNDVVAPYRRTEYLLRDRIQVVTESNTRMKISRIDLDDRSTISEAYESLMSSHFKDSGVQNIPKDFSEWISGKVNGKKVSVPEGKTNAFKRYIYELISNSSASEGISDMYLGMDETLDDINKKAVDISMTARNSSPMFGTKNMPECRFNGKAPALVKNDKLISMEPTMINVSFYLHGAKNNSGGASVTQNVTLGVKCMVRNVSSEYMVSNLVEGSKSSNPIFKLISWTRGEFKLVKDLIFNISEIKKKFKTKKSGDFDFLQMSRNRKEVDDIAKYAGNRVLPYMSIVTTDYSVAQAAQITGVDLNQLKNAQAFMDRYYLLAFAIYNTSTKELSVLYDGADTFEHMSMTYIQSTQKKDMDITKNLGNLASIR